VSVQPTAAGLAVATETTAGGESRGVIRISGPVDLDNAPLLFDELGLWTTAQAIDDFVIDLSGLERASSVLVAMLIELTEIVRVWRGRVTVRAGGDDLQAVAAFYGVQDLLTFAEEPSE
jgi:ABC-type transporter Mla MlaB component